VRTDLLINEPGASAELRAAGPGFDPLPAPRSGNQVAAALQGFKCYRFATSIVISKPKRISAAVGVAHFMVKLLLDR